MTKNTYKKVKLLLKNGMGLRIKKLTLWESTEKPDFYGGHKKLIYLGDCLKGVGLDSL